MSDRLIRTVLCVPGHDERKVARCRDWGADLVLFDLEDAVPADQKDRARAIVREAVTPADHVRLSAAVPLPADRECAERAGAWWLPKVRDCAAIHWTDKPVVPIVESPEAALSLYHLRPNGLLAGLAFGRADFMAAAALGRHQQRCDGERPLVRHVRLQVVLTALALGIPSFDSPCEHRDSAVAACEADDAAWLGFTAKGCAYPRHVMVTAEAYRLAAKVMAIEAAGDLGAGGAGVVEVDGRVVAPPHRRAAVEVMRAG